jgi:hypothetical protein
MELNPVAAVPLIIEYGTARDAGGKKSGVLPWTKR